MFQNYVWTNKTMNITINVIMTDPLWLDILNGCIVGFVLLAGLFVNVALLSLFMIKSHLRSPTNLLLSSLSISNLFGCLLVLTSMLKNITTNNTYDGAYCDITALFSQLWWLSNIFTLMFLSYDHYIYISRPLEYYRVITHNKTYIFIAITWVLSATVSLVPIFGEPRYIFRPEQHTCGVDWNKSQIFNIIFIVIAFWIPCCVMIYCYACIVKDAQKTFKVRSKCSKISPTPMNEGRKSVSIERKLSLLSRLNFKQNQKRRESIYGTVKTSFVIFGTFALAWTPQFMLILLHSIQYDNIDMRAQKLIHTIKYLPIFVYPYIFGFRNPVLWRQLKKLSNHLHHCRDVRKIHPTKNIDEEDYHGNVSRRNSRTEISESRKNSSAISFKDFIYAQSQGPSRQHSISVDIGNTSRRSSSESGMTNVFI